MTTPPALSHKPDADNAMETPSDEAAQAYRTRAENVATVRRGADNTTETPSAEMARAYPAKSSGAEIAPEGLVHFTSEDTVVTPQGRVETAPSVENVTGRQKRSQFKEKPVLKTSGKQPSGVAQRTDAALPRTAKERGARDIRTAKERGARDIRTAKERGARDIRTAIPRNAAPRPWTAEPLITPALTDAAAPFPGTPDTPERNAQDSNGLSPLSLTFPRPGEEADAAPTAKAGTSGNEAAPLPEWAQKLLEKPGSNLFDASGASGTAISRVPAARQIEWTAPNAISPTLPRPASITLLERQAPQQQEPPPSMSEAEIRRTADKIYRIIEERLQRELRRSGK